MSLLTVVAVGWFVANWDHPRGPQELGWLAPLASQLVVSAALWETGQVAGLAPVARRFWRQLAVASLLCSAGLLGQLLYAALDISAGVGKVSPAAAPFFVAGLLYAVWALIRVPVGISARGEWIRLSLDVATVTLGAALFLWFVTFGPLVTRGGAWAVWAPLTVGVACLVSLSAVIKIVLVGSGPLDRGALQLLGASLLIGGVGSGAVGLLVDKPQIVPGQLLGPPLGLLMILACERQRRAVHAQPRPRATPRRLVGLLPYTAVAVTDVLLIVATMVTVDERRYVVVVGAIVITALVVARQVVAVSDNDRLVVRLRHQEEQLRHQASHDVLTQLANRVLFSERLDAALADGDRDVTVLLIDLDDFKSVNDTLGHTVGDQLLAAVAGRIRGCVRADATVARLGGDEFAVLLLGDCVDAVEVISDRVLASLAQPIALDGYELLVQASIGVASACPGDDAEALLRNADIAMYAAKERGKGSFAHYAPGMAAGILEQAQLGAQLRQALEDNQLFLLYQPVVRLADRHILGMEALVRWQHPTRGLLSPVDFIPAAERTGLIVPLGRWVLQEACRQKAAWREAYGELSPATIGVNVSGRQLREPGFADEVADAVRAAEPGAAQPGARGDRDGDPLRPPGHGHAARAQGVRGVHRAGRLRYRAVVAEPDPDLPGAHPQARQVVRAGRRGGRGRPGRAAGRRGQGGGRPRRRARTGRRGRGDRERGAGQAPGRARLPAGAGLPPGPAAARRRPRPPARRRRRPQLTRVPAATPAPLWATFSRL